MRFLKVLAVAAAIASLGGCTKPAESSVHTGNGGGFKVEKLFTVDGCTVYRFLDSRYYYFTNCPGSTFGTTGGKTPYDVGVMGGGQ